MKQFFPNITVDETVQFGKPVIAGTRVPVEVVVGHIAAGDTADEVMREYQLTREQVYAALKYASRVVAEESLLVA